MNPGRQPLIEPGADPGGHIPAGPNGLELTPTDSRLIEQSREELLAGIDESLIPEAGAPPATPSAAEPTFGEAFALSILGDEDDRVPVADPTAFPWQALCYLRILAADGSPLRGTGWLAGPQLVVTAGHCVFQEEHGGWARSVDVTPGRNGDRAAADTLTVPQAGLRSVSGWIQRQDREFDYGALLLPRSLAASVGFFGFTVADADDLRTHAWNLAGYPVDQPAGTLWWHARRIELVRTNTLLYTIDTKGGQSGAPLWRHETNGPLVAGIHTGERTTANQAVRINPSVYANLVSWKQLGS